MERKSVHAQIDMHWARVQHLLVSLQQFVARTNVTQLQVTRQFLTIRQLAHDCADDVANCPTRSTLETRARTCASLPFPLGTQFSRNPTLFAAIFSLLTGSFVTSRTNLMKGKKRRSDTRDGAISSAMREFFGRKISQNTR